MRPGSYAERAPAKVNLGLAVLTRRGDGFHEIETLMAQVGLFDDVVLNVELPTGEPVPAALELEMADGAGDLPGAETLTSDGSNLALKAANAYLRAHASAGVAAPTPNVSVRLVKRVPVAAGLGGGSSDAGAVLRALARADAAAAPDGQPLVTTAALQQLALELGSDVPFFLGSALAAVARGRGERLTPLDLPSLHLVLANPGTAISASSAYQALVGFTPRLRPERALARLAEGLDPGWSNGLQPGVLRAHPELRELLAALRGAGLKGVIMSGSGPTCVGVAASGAAAEAVAAELRLADPRLWVRAVTTLSD
ncbi:MAG: hypothetical protein WDA03_04580 [Trueperaceae bacterium]